MLNDQKWPKYLVVKHVDEVYSLNFYYGCGFCIKQELDLFIRVIFAIMNIWVEVGNTIFQEICSYSSVSNSAMVHGALSSWHDFCGVVDIFQNNFESDSCKKAKAELLLLPASQQSYSNNGMIRILHRPPSSKLEWIIFVVVQHYLYLSMKEIHLLY